MATLDESNRAKRLLIKNKQKGFLSSNEIKTESANSSSVFLDKNSLLRVKGRLENSLLPYETKFPFLLNKNSLLVRAIIFDCHRKVFYSGLKNTINELNCILLVTQAEEY